MMKAAAPMIGGVICPPDDAQASTAAANRARYPRFFISGMVKEPVVTTFATADPDTVPMNPLATAEALAGPPTRWPVNATARSIKKRPAPERIRTAPKMMNKTI